MKFSKFSVMFAATLAANAVFGASVSALKFKKLNDVAGLGLANNVTYLAVAYDGYSNIMAVGSNQVVLAGIFQSNQTFLLPGNFTLSNARPPTNALTAVAGNAGQFVTFGDGNLASVWQGGIWTTNGRVFANNVQGSGLAFNNNQFVAVEAAPAIAFTGLPVPAGTWNSATHFNPSLSFAESFRAVAPYGANRFAACGVFGVVRTSTTDANSTWTKPRTGSTTDPTLLGICGGGTALVAVGTITNSGNTGFITYSPDGSDSSFTDFSLPLQNSTLHSVAYTGAGSSAGGFIAVGDNGQVWSSPDGTASTWNTNSEAMTLANGVSLYGVAFGSQGLLQGLGLLVGSNGIVILAGTPPPPVTNARSATNCSLVAIPPTNILTVDITLDSDHPPGSVTVDWYNALGAPVPALAISNVTGNVYRSVLVPTNDLPYGANSSLITTFTAVSRDLRTGFTNSTTQTATLRIDPTPTSTLSGPAFVCNGDTAIIDVSFTGLGPWDFDLTQNGTLVYSNASALRTNHISFTLTDADLNASAPYTFKVSRLRDLGSLSGCQSPPIAISNVWTTVVNPRPTSAVSAPVAVCNGDTNYVQVTLTGLGPTWNFVLSSNGVDVYSTNFTARTTLIPIAFSDPNLDTNITSVFKVSSLQDNASPTQCTAQPDDISNVVATVVNPRPTSTVTGPSAVCNGDTNAVQVALTGLGPTWDYVLNSNGIAIFSSNGAPRVSSIPIVFSNGDSNAAATGVFQVAFLQDDGGLTHCPAWAIDLISTQLVNINPRPTSFVSGPTVVCSGDTNSLEVDLTGIGPTWKFILTSNDVAILTNSAASRTNLVPIVLNDADPNGSTNATYKLSSLIDLGAATQCPANPNDILSAQPVTAYPRPTSAVTAASAVCNGDTNQVQVVLTGIGPAWSLVVSSNGVDVYTNTAATQTNTFQVIYSSTNVNAASNAVFKVSSLIDLGSPTMCPASANDISNAASTAINPKPTATVSIPALVYDGDSNVVQVVLTGKGPNWQFVLTSNSIPVFTNLAAIRTNLVPVIFSNTNQYASNAVFMVSSLIDLAVPTQCAADPSGITSMAATIINPRPTATLTSTNAANLFATTNCGGGSYNITNILTGLGPWLVQWSDGTNYTNNGTVGPIEDVRLVTTTITNGATSPKTNTFVISSLTDSFGHAAKAQDIHGTTRIVTDEVATGTFNLPLANITALSTNSAQKNMLVSATNVSPTEIDVRTRFTYTNTSHKIITNQSINLIVQPRVSSLTGTPRWTVVFSDQNETTNVSTATTTAVATWTFPIFRSSPATNFILSVANFYDTNGCPGDTSGFPTITVAVNTNATANLTVEDSGSTCTGVTNHIDVDLGGVAPWTIVWSDGITNKAIATTPFVRDVVFTNNTLTPITNTYSITYVSDKYSTNTDTNILSDVATIIVDPTPPGPPISLGDKISCLDVAVSLGVTVAPGFTADWYTDPTLTNQVASGTTNFVPTVPVDLQSNSSVTNTYYVVERFPDDALLNPCWSSPTNVTLISTSCVQTVTLSKTKTNILTSFSGNYILQATTDLTPPPAWTDIATGAPGVLTIITNAVPPAATTNSEFFRLRVPQTSP